MSQAVAVDLARMDYEQCLALQHRVHQARVEGLIPDCLLLVEHPHVLTIGRRGKTANILVPEQLLRTRDIPCVPIERGGDVTYHGPGQLIGYPIFALKGKGKGVSEHVERLEEVMIRILREYGISGERNAKNRGVWVGNAKIGFVGIAVRRGISLHGIALNAAPDLSFFEMIHTCGLKGVEVTSIQRLRGSAVSLEELKARAISRFEEVFDLSLESLRLDDLEGKIRPKS
jgi:lipoyl(octanoyl) transferase